MKVAHNESECAHVIYTSQHFHHSKTLMIRSEVLVDEFRPVRFIESEMIEAIAHSEPIQIRRTFDGCNNMYREP